MRNGRTAEQRDGTASNYSRTRDERNEGAIITQGIKHGTGETKIIA